jgi:hypothetical protein
MGYWGSSRQIPNAMFATVACCRCNRIKLMYWDTDGIANWMKKQKAEYTHFDIYIEVGIGRIFNGIANESS